MKDTFNIATAPRRNSKHWRAGEITWDDIVSWMDNPASKKEAGGYVMGELGPCECSQEKCQCSRRACDHKARRKDTLISRSMLTLDIDHPTPSFTARLEDGLGLAVACQSIVHTTYSSSPDALRYRVLARTSRDMDAVEYYRVSTVFMDDLGTEQFDPGSSQPERYMFRPAAQQLEWFRFWVLDGPPIDVDAYLERWDPERYAPVDPKPSANKKDPLTLGGVVGAFNRTYDIDDVITEYALPYEKAGERRWHLVGAASEAGMGEVAPGLVFSHHVKDPAGGQTCSAFDLVRLHRYGHLDGPEDEAKPVNRRPSHEAMSELATQDAKVLGEMVGMDFDTELDDDLQTDWRLGLTFSARTGRMQDVVANWDLIREHDPIFRMLYWNEMTLSLEADDDLPWRPLGRGGPTFTGNDVAELTMYIERTYKLRPTRTLVEDLVRATAMRRFVNPVRDWLEGLKWDGVSRVETALPGVEPTRYTRLVARKSLVAAVARMLNPGVKWDHSLVLYGDEGLGKSYWIDRMSRGWSASLGRIGDKDTLLAMQRTWIMIADEGHSLKKADSDVQKEFLTRTEDLFRMPFEKDTLLHKRHCVIWSTTNDEIFLRRQKGNRRFLIVHCEHKVDFEALTDDYIDQVWAEAVVLYRAGERLFLSESESTLATAERENYTEEDALGGLIAHFLNTPVPEDWDLMSPESRIQWLQNRADNLVPAGTQKMSSTCSLQIWVEALGRRIGDHRRMDLLEINEALKRVPGWKALGSRHRVPHYGPQLVFVRDEDGLL